MITIEYCAQGEAVSDFAVRDWLDLVLNSTSGSVFRISTEAPVHALQLAIVSGTIAANNVTFMYCGHAFQANEYGAIPERPLGFCDRSVAYSEDIVRAAMQKRRRERNANVANTQEAI